MMMKKSAFYSALGKDAPSIFPLRFAAEPGLATGAAAGEVEGFYRGSPKTGTTSLDHLVDHTEKRRERSLS